MAEDVQRGIMIEVARVFQGPGAMMMGSESVLPAADVEVCEVVILSSLGAVPVSTSNIYLEVKLVV